MAGDKVERLSSVYVFHGEKAKFAAAVFTDFVAAEKAIRKDKLSGMLTFYPLNETVFEYTVRKQLFSPSGNENGDYISRFTSAVLEHYHYENGKRI